jgi:putative tryptophan/tyrosine transport system substrate-binding protein
MTRRIVGVFVTLVFTLLVAPLAAEAQPPTKVYRVGWLHPGSSVGPNTTLEPFRQGLREFGYIEGQNLIMNLSHY